MKKVVISLRFSKDLAEVAAQKKLKMAIVDGSCYSGETLKIAQIPGLKNLHYQRKFWPRNKQCSCNTSTDQGLVQGPIFKAVTFKDARLQTGSSTIFIWESRYQQPPPFLKFLIPLEPFYRKSFSETLSIFKAPPRSLSRRFRCLSTKDMQVFKGKSTGQTKSPKRKISALMDRVYPRMMNLKDESILTQLVLNIGMSSLHQATKNTWIRLPSTINWLTKCCLPKIPLPMLGLSFCSTTETY